MSRLVIIIIFLITFVSCKDQNKAVLQKINLESKTLFSDSDLDMSTPVAVQIVDSLLVTVNFKNDTHIDVWNLNPPKKLNSFLKKGNGPLEFRRVDSFRANNNDSCINFYDIDGKGLFKISYNELMSESPSIQKVFSWSLDDNTPFVLYETYKLGDSYFAVNKTDTARFLFSDEQNNIKPYEKFPDKNNVNPNLSEMGNAQLYSSRIAISPNMKQIMVLSEVSDMLDVIKIEDDGLSVKTTVATFPNDIYMMPMKDNFVYGLHTSKTKYYHINVCATDKYVYAIWKGDIHDRKKHPGLMVSNIVKVYDWDGNECYELILDRDIFNLTVSPDNQTMYALTDKVEGYAILKYEMDLY